MIKNLQLLVLIFTLVYGQYSFAQVNENTKSKIISNVLLSDTDAAALKKADLVIIIRKNGRVDIDSIKNKTPVKILNQNIPFRINIDSLNSTFWRVGDDEFGRGGEQVNRRDLIKEVYGKDMTEIFKLKIISTLDELGIYPVTFGGNSFTEGRSADAQVFLRVDMESPRRKQMLEEIKRKEFAVLNEIEARPLYEEHKLGNQITLDPATQLNLKFNNDTLEHVVGLFSFDKRDESLVNIGSRTEMIVKPNSVSKDFTLKKSFCNSQRLIIVMFSDATFAEIPINEICKNAVAINLKGFDKYKIIANRSKKKWVDAFYSLYTFKFSKTDGISSGVNFSGKGWTNFHGDTHVSNFKNGLREGQGNFCYETQLDYINVDIHVYENGYSTKNLSYPLYPKKINKDPTNDYKIIPFNEIHSRFCLLVPN